MIPPHYGGQPQFAHLRGHTPSASPPINGMAYVPRQHTPQPQIGSRPSSRTDFRRPPSVTQPGMPQPPPVTNGYAFMPQPAIYNPQNQPPPMTHGLPHPQYPYPPPQPHPQMHSYMEEQRRSSVPPSYPQSQPARPHPSPQPPQQQLPPQAPTHMSPPQPPHQHIEPPPQPQQQQQPPPPPPPQHPEPHSEPQPPPAPMELKREISQERASQPLLDTASAIKKMPQRKQHSIFTPIDENRSILSQHLASFDKESRVKDEGNSRAQSVDVGAVARTNGNPSPPPPPQRSNTSNLSQVHTVASSHTERTFSPPSRSNSLKSGGGARPRLKVQIPDEQSDAGSNTAESNTSPRTTADTTQRNGTEPQSSVVVLPPPSPSASALLSAGATGPPNPFARPPPHSQGNNNMNIDTPVSALPSRFLNNEFLPSPSSFYPEWNFRGSDSNTLPSPLNFATPVVGSGPSFLRDDNPPPSTNKRKSPEISGTGPTSEGPDILESKRIKVDG